jgi:hypothetical protein
MAIRIIRDREEFHAMIGDLRNISLSCLALLAIWISPLSGQAVPGNLKATASGPTTVGLTWTAAPNANGYVVQRALGSASLTRLTPDKIQGTSYSDATAPAGSTLRYRVKAAYPGGQPTFSDIVSVTTPTAPANTASGGDPTPPPGQPTATTTTVVSAVAPLKVYQPSGLTPRTLTPIAVDPAANTAPATLAPPPVADPTGFTAALQGNKVVLTWQAVSGVSWYLLGGPGMGQYGQQVQGTSYSFDSPGPGQHQWTVASLAGQGQGPVNYWGNWPKAQLTVAPEVVHSGRYRVTIIGFRVNEQTVDDWWNWDGKGDEVYLTAYVGLKDRRNGTMGPRGHVRSVVYGDVNNLPNRILAGTVSDLGGLKTGDSYPIQAGDVLPAAGPEVDRIPLMVWEGPLTDGSEELVVAPSLWESDQHDAGYIAWWQKLDVVIPDVFNDNTVAADVATPDLHPVVARELDLGIPGPGVDRPLGMRPVGASIGWVRQQVVVITREKIESAFTSQYRIGSSPVGVVPVSLVDWTDDRVGLRGAYTMYLRVERVP